MGTRAWFPVACAQLSGFAAGHALPGGGATSTATALRLLADRDFVRTTVGRRWQVPLWAAAGDTVFDYLALLAAL